MELVFTELDLQAPFQSNRHGNLQFRMMMHDLILGSYRSLIPAVFPGTKIHSSISSPYNTLKNL